MTLFKLFRGTPDQVEGDLNTWSEHLPPRTKIRRTQLAATVPAPIPPGMYSVGPSAEIIVLINYDLSEVG